MFAQFRVPRNLQFNVVSELQIFEKLIHGSFNLLSEFLAEICWEEIAEEIFFSYFVLMSDLGYDMSIKPTHHLHTYIHIIAHYRPLFRFMSSLLTLLMLWVLILYMSGGTYIFKSTSKDSFLEKFFMWILLWCFFSAKKMSPSYKVH